MHIPEDRNLSRRTVLRATALLGALSATGALATTTPAHAAAADDFAAMRTQWRGLHVADAYDPNDPALADVLAAIGKAAQDSWTTLNTATDRTYLWEDAKLDVDQSFAISRSFWRLYTMALGWATKGSSVAGDADLLAATIAGLDWMVANYYREDGQIIGNWYEWVISGPMAFNDAAVLLFEKLTAEQVAAYARSVANFTPEPSGTAANRALTSTVVVGRGTLAGDAATVQKGVDGLPPVLTYVESGDGFYRDGSFIQHDYHPYIGAYGASILEALVPIFTITAGTSWQVDAPIVYDWLENAIDPFIWNGALMDMVSGRTIARWNEHEHYHGHYVIGPALRLLPIAPPDRLARLRSMVKEWLLSDNYDDPTPTSTIPVLLAATALKDDDAVDRRGPLVLSKVFHNEDRVVHRRPAWTLAISMRSSRIANFESINGENLRGWLTANGAMYLYVGVSDQFMDGFWATIDHARLPGITTDVRERAPREGEGTRSPQAWAGGASLGARYSAAGFPLVEQGSTLTARKSWFCFDNEVVALGAAITASDGRHVETVVENRRLGESGIEKLLVDGREPVRELGSSATVEGARWMHLAGTGGYVLLTPTTVKLTREARTGRWSDVTQHPNWVDETPMTRNYLTALVDHGADPTGATYAYVLLPTTSAAHTGRYSAHPRVKVLANSQALQAVRQLDGDVFAASFWSPGKVSGVATTGAASIVVRRKDSETRLAVADPARGSAKFTVTVEGRYGKVISADQGLRVTSLRPLTVEVDPAGTAGGTLQLRVTAT